MTEKIPLLRARALGQNRDLEMKQFMLLHVGFEMPTAEIMDQWNKWFADTKDVTVDMGGFMNGCEMTKGGITELGMDLEALTGYSIIEAASREEAEKLASGNPFISAIRIYEIRKH